MRCSALMICWNCDVSDQCRMLSVCLKGSVRILDTKSLKLEEGAGSCAVRRCSSVCRADVSICVSSVTLCVSMIFCLPFLVMMRGLISVSV